MATVHELCCDARPESLATVADFIATCCAEWRVGGRDAYRIQLAVDEAVSNVIEHAYESKGGEILLRCWCDHGDISVQLEDSGRPFDPDGVVEPRLTGALEEREAGGLGLYFMSALMDRVVFLRDGAKNILLMIKRNAVS